MSKDSTGPNNCLLLAIKEAWVRGADAVRDKLKSSLSLSLVHSSHLGMEGNTFNLQGQ